MGGIGGEGDGDDKASHTTPRRTTTHPQGCHQKMARLSVGKNSSPELALANLKEFFRRWNLVQAARHHGLPRSILGFSEQNLLEEIQIITHGWYDEPLYCGLRSTKDFAPTGEKFGVVPVAADPEAGAGTAAGQGEEGKEEGVGDEGEGEGGGDDDEEGAGAAEDAEEVEAAEEVEVEGLGLFGGLTRSVGCVRLYASGRTINPPTKTRAQ